MMAADSKLLTPEEVAERLNVSRLTVMKWLRQGKIVGRKLGGKIWRIDPEALDAFLAASRVEHREGKEVRPSNDKE